MDYKNLTDYYEKLESTSKRLEKTSILAQVLREAKKEKDAESIINLLRGSVFPAWEQKKIGVSDKLIIKALSTSTGNSKDKIEKLFRKTGDLGLVGEELTVNRKQTTLGSKKLTCDFVQNKIRQLADLEGEGTVNKKIGLISELLTSASPVEAKFIVRTILEQLRIGVADGTLRDAIVWCFFHDKLKIRYELKDNELTIPEDTKIEYERYIEKIQQGYDLTSDFAEVYKII